MSNRKNNFPNVAEPSATPQEISQSIKGFNELMKLKPCTKNEPDEVRKRIEDMFLYCENEGRKPTVELLTVFLGVTRTALWQWQQDPNSEAGQLVTQAKNLLNLLTTEWAMDGKLPYVYGIFLQKNHHGYSDTIDIAAVQRPNLLETLPSKEQIIKRLPELADGETEPDVDGII